MIGIICDRRIFLHEFSLHVGCSAALPDNCVIDRLACCTVPYDNCFSLVCDADGSNILIGGTNILHCLARDRKLCLPDLVCVMLNPARLREILCEFLLRNAADLTLFIEKDAAVAGRTCIKCHYVLCHKNTLLYPERDRDPAPK